MRRIPKCLRSVLNVDCFFSNIRFISFGNKILMVGVSFRDSLFVSTRNSGDGGHGLALDELPSFTGFKSLTTQPGRLSLSQYFCSDIYFSFRF